MIPKKIVASIIMTCFLLVSLGALEQYRQAQANEKFPAPGRLIDIDGRKLQVDCRGSGTPTVVLESGGDDIFGSLGWSHLHDDMASMTRVCAYSRAGYLWSESRSEVLEAEGGARDLHTALSLAGESPPFLPIGYSRGAFNTLIFTDLFGAEVAAVIFLEPRHPELEARRAQAGIEQGTETPLMLARFARALRWTGLPRVFADYCEAAWYPDEIVDVCKAYLPHSLNGIISEDSEMQSVQSRAARVQDLGELPVLVITRQLKEEWLGSDEAVRTEVQKSEDLWRQLHAEIASWSTHGEQRVVAGSTHQLPYTHPEAVFDAVKSSIDLVRQNVRN